MNVTEQEVEVLANVVPLFGRVEDLSDPLKELLLEGSYNFNFEVEQEKSPTSGPRDIVLETQFPDQSVFVLEKQLSSLRSSLDRLRFYLGDVEDLLPR